MVDGRPAPPGGQARHCVAGGTAEVHDRSGGNRHGPAVPPPSPARGDLEVFVNISQMTVSRMSLTEMTDSPQPRQHWRAEQVLNWSGLPVVDVRPTAFLQNFSFLPWAAE